MWSDVALQPPHMKLHTSPQFPFICQEVWRQKLPASVHFLLGQFGRCLVPVVAVLAQSMLFLLLYHFVVLYSFSPLLADCFLLILLPVLAFLAAVLFQLISLLSTCWQHHTLHPHLLGISVFQNLSFLWFCYA